MVVGCSKKEPISVGATYTVVLKWGTANSCFADRAAFQHEEALEQSAPERVIVFERRNATWIRPGTRVKLLEKSRDGEQLKLEILPTRIVCYTANDGAGPGGGLFATCPSVGGFYWSVPAMTCESKGT